MVLALGGVLWPEREDGGFRDIVNVPLLLDLSVYYMNVFGL